MKRYYGSAVFESEEVADFDHTRLIDIRGEEQRRVESHEREFKMQIDELNYWRKDELTTIALRTSRSVNDQKELIYRCRQNIANIEANANAAIATARAFYFSKFEVHGSKEELAEVARITANANIQTTIQKNTIRSCNYEILRLRHEAIRAVAQVHTDYKIEYNIRTARRDKDIAWSHDDAAKRITAILAARYNLPVYMLRCAIGPCDFCREKYGTTGTLEELRKLKCIPPFHEDCRCWLEEVGYVVMSGIR